MMGNERLTIPDSLKLNAKHYPNDQAVHYKVGDLWQTFTWSEYANSMQAVAKSLIATGHAHGEALAILGSNSFEWFVSVVGAEDVGVVPAGVYASNAPVEVAYVVNHSGAKSIIVEDYDQLAKVKQQWSEMPALERAILLNGEVEDDDRIISWKEFLEIGTEISEADLIARESAITLNDVGTLIYTSGTTGNPKGVLLSNESISFTSDALGSTLNTNHKDVLLSYLPLAHIAEQLVSIHIAIRRRYQVYICPDPLKLADYIKEVRPTVFFGVPRVWERFYTVISAKLQDATGIKKQIISFARSAGTAVSRARHQGLQPGLFTRLRFRLAEKLVFSKLREAMGLDRAHNFLTGSAPTPEPVADFFSSLGMELLEVYGQSEGTACTTANTLSNLRRGTLGKAIPGIQVKIADDGEILFKGPSCMVGYLNAEEATAKTLVDGWVHTGDLGMLDNDGYLIIKGRKKDIIINSSGKNIAPKAIEGLLISLDCVAQAVCIGDGQRFLVALLTLDPDRAAIFAEEHNCSLADVPAHPELRHLLFEEIRDKVNTKLARVEQVRNFLVLPHLFSPETGETTVTFKIKRNVVSEKYAKQIAALYEEGQLL